MLFTIPEVFYRMNSRLLLSVLSCGALAFPALAHSKKDKSPVMNRCKSEIRVQAREQFGAKRVSFEAVRIQPTSEGNAWITGTVRMENGHHASLDSFSCSANLNSGMLHNAHLRPRANYQARANWSGNHMNRQADPPAATNRETPRETATNRQTTPAATTQGVAYRVIGPSAIANCHSAAASQMRHDGYGDIRFKTTNVGYFSNGEQVFGRAKASGWYLGKTFSYACSVDSRGDVMHASAAMH